MGYKQSLVENVVEAYTEKTLVVHSIQGVAVGVRPGTQMDLVGMPLV